MDNVRWAEFKKKTVDGNKPLFLRVGDIDCVIGNKLYMRGIGGYQAQAYELDMTPEEIIAIIRVADYHPVNL